MAKCKVLFLAANPQATERLALDEEIRSVERLIRASEYRDSMELISRWAVRPDDLLQALNEHKPQIVHFSGHGSPQNCLLLQGDDGSTKPVSESALAKLFQLFREHVQLVLLNACFSEQQAKAIVSSVNCAIGMNTAVGDEAAIVFSASFYRAIGFGCSIHDAFEQGKLAVELAGPTATKPTRGGKFNGVELDGSKQETGQHAIPQLMVRQGQDAKQLILIPEPPPSTKQPTQNIDRGISIGGNASGGVFVTGNQNVISSSTQVFTNNQSNSIDIQAVIAVLNEKLTGLASEDQKKVSRAFEDINDELQGGKPDRGEVGVALERALRYASESDCFSAIQSHIKPSVEQAIEWLGPDWSKLQRHLR